MRNRVGCVGYAKYDIKTRSFVYSITMYKPSIFCDISSLNKQTSS